MTIRFEPTAAARPEESPTTTTVSAAKSPPLTSEFSVQDEIKFSQKLPSDYRSVEMGEDIDPLSRANQKYNQAHTQYVDKSMDFICGKEGESGQRTAHDAHARTASWTAWSNPELPEQKREELLQASKNHWANVAGSPEEAQTLYGLHNKLFHSDVQKGIETHKSEIEELKKQYADADGDTEKRDLKIQLAKQKHNLSKLEYAKAHREYLDKLDSFKGEGNLAQLKFADAHARGATWHAWSNESLSEGERDAYVKTGEEQWATFAGTDGASKLRDLHEALYRAHGMKNLQSETLKALTQ